MPGAEKEIIPRKSVLTESDLAMIAEIIKEHGHCNMGLTPLEVEQFRKGFTPEEIGILKRVVAAFDRAAEVIGRTVLTTLVAMFIALLAGGFWALVISKVKQAGGH